MGYFSELAIEINEAMAAVQAHPGRIVYEDSDDQHDGDSLAMIAMLVSRRDEQIQALTAKISTLEAELALARGAAGLPDEGSGFIDAVLHDARRITSEPKTVDFYGQVPLPGQDHEDTGE